MPLALAPAAQGIFNKLYIYLKKKKHFAKRATAEVMFGQGLFDTCIL